MRPTVQHPARLDPTNPDFLVGESGPEPTPGEPVRRKDSPKIAVKQVTPEHARTCERWFDPELKPHPNGASMQVTVNGIDTRYVLSMRVFTTPQMKPHSDKCAANVRRNRTASIVDETVRSLLTETYRKTRPEVVVDSIMDARFEILDATHLSPVEETQRFAAFLETFLRENV
jgi:hypothetical protein